MTPPEGSTVRQFRFLHEADLNSDSPFVGLRSAAAEHVAGTLQKAPYSAYDRVIEIAFSKQVEFVLIAGDIYDGKDRSFRAQLRFRDCLAHLASCRRPPATIFTEFPKRAFPFQR